MSQPSNANGPEDSADDMFYFGSADPPSQLDAPKPPPDPRRNIPLHQIPARAWIRAVVAAVVGYLFVLVIVGGLAAWVSGALHLEPDTSTPGMGLSLWAYSPQIMAMSLGGVVTSRSYTLGGGAPGFDVSTHLVVPLLPVTLIICVVMFLWTRRSARRIVPTAPGALALSAVTGISLALLTNAMAAAGQVNGGGEFVHVTTGAAGGRTIVGAFFVGFVISAMTWLACSGIWASWTRRFRFLVGSGVRVALVHLAFLVAAFTVVGALAVGTGTVSGESLESMGISGDPLFLIGVLLNVGAYLAVVGSLGSVSGASRTMEMFTLGPGATSIKVEPGTEVTEEVTYEAGSEAFSINLHTLNDADVIGPGPPWLMPALVATAVLACIGAALLLAARRTAVRPSGASWFTTVGIYAAIGLVLQLALQISETTTNTDPSWPLTPDAYLGPPPWTFLIFAAWGATVEALARFAFPKVVGRMKPRTLRVLQKISGADRVAETEDEAVAEMPAARKPGVAEDPDQPKPPSAQAPVLDYRTPESDLDLFRPPPPPCED